MSGALGINVSGDGAITPQSVRDLGATWARVVLLPQFDLRAYIGALHTLGINVLGVIARESLGPGPMSSGAAATFYADKYAARLDALQVGNEADHVSPSSWTLSHADLNALIAAFRATFPAPTRLIGPGLVSGDPSYVSGIDLSKLDGIAVHPYGQRPGGTAPEWEGLPGNFGSVANLLDRYRAVAPGVPIWITEVGVSTTECSPAFQGRYCEAMLKALRLRADVPMSAWFCAGDWMVPEFGLYDLQGNPKPAADAFKRAAETAVPVDQPKFVLGFAKVASANPALVGGPLENEYGFAQGISLQRTTNGILFWTDTVSSGSQMGFIDLRDGARYRWIPASGLLVQVTA